MPMYTKEFGTAERLTATGYSTLSSANACLIGVQFNGSGTGVTASGTIVGITAYRTAANATANEGKYYPIPAYASGGLTVHVGVSLDPNITLYWSPV